MKKILTIKNYLLISNLVLVIALIVLSDFGVLPLRNIGDFAFFAILIFLLALYRPAWSFLFFVGTIMLENINLAPQEIGLSLRPFQLIGFLTLGAVIVRYFSGRLGFKLPKFSKIDVLVSIFLLAGFISVVFSPEKDIAFKQATVLLSFGTLYALTEIFIQDLSDLKKTLPFLLSSSFVIMLYGIWQNWQFVHNAVHFEIMPGRPNATFTEPDWLGVYLVMMLSALYAMIFNFKLSDLKRHLAENDEIKEKSKMLFFEKIKEQKFYRDFFADYFLLGITYVLLILTVSRSAWLGAGALSLIYLIICVWFFGVKNKKWKIFVDILRTLAVASVGAVVIVYGLGLTKFEVGKRLQSTGGKQEITVACQQDSVLKNRQIISDVSELEKYACRHINLEDIAKEKNAGKKILKIYRNDPNVNIRSEIYKKSWGQIKKHPLVGIGWGNISQILGKDENGNGLNSSNIFLEVWLGSGIIGIVSFVGLWAVIFWRIVQKIFFRKEEIGYDLFAVNLFLLLGFFAVLVPNMFNAGIMLGFLWVWLGMARGILKE